MRKFFYILYLFFFIIFILFNIFLLNASAVDNNYDDIDTIKFELQDLGNNVSIHTDLQRQYLCGAYDDISSYVDGLSDLDGQEPVILEWCISGASTFTNLEYCVELYRDNTNNLIKTYYTNDYSVSINNLELGTKYFWRVSTIINNIKYSSDFSSFLTECYGLRNLEVDGVNNVRDIGGDYTLDGNRIKQGNIYRSAQFNDRYGVSLITESGKETKLNDFKIKTEIDFRMDDNMIVFDNRSALGESVTYYNCPLESYGSIIESSDIEDNEKSIREVMAILSDESNYPVDMHCKIGTDRTGFVCYILKALLNVDETDIMQDYLFSNFANIGTQRSVYSIKNKYPRIIKNFKGNSLQEKTYNYLNEIIGVPTYQLDKIIEINTIYDNSSISGYSPILSESDFLNMNPNNKYYLACNISVDSTYYSNFKGELYGNNKVITTSVPLFEVFSGKVCNLTVSGKIESDDGFTGSIAKKSSGGRFDSIVNNTIIENDSQSDAGGIVGIALNGTYFIKCNNNASVSSFGNSGGLAGCTNDNIVIESCINRGKIVSVLNNSGGLVAEVNGPAFIQNCYNYGKVIGNSTYTGGICGAAFSSLSFNTFISCKNYANITCGTIDNHIDEISYIGGIAGYTEAAHSLTTFSNCTNGSNIISYSNSYTYVSGIIGYIYSPCILFSYNESKGSLSADYSMYPFINKMFYNKTTSRLDWIHDNVGFYLQKDDNGEFKDAFDDYLINNSLDITSYSFETIDCKLNQLGDYPKWVLVKSKSSFESSSKYQKINDIILRNKFTSIPFVFEYSLYDVSTSTFYPIEVALCNDLFDGLKEMLIKNNVCDLLGDINKDGKLNIVDSTNIQLILAGFSNWSDDDQVDGMYDKLIGDTVFFVSDVNLDGERNIGDATYLQMSLINK